ncbi:MAG: HupE/UreJ family protein [Planctomycetia bacterium]|nr:HupE/UreJ family protein [Planctomycetia bacterium]
MRRPTLLLAALVLVATARDAHAHLVNTGFGPFYDGLAHPLVVVSDLLPALAVALLGGLRGPGTGRAVVIALPVAWLAGMALGAATALPPPPPASGAALTALLGVLVASDRPWPRAAVVGAAVVAGVALGLGNGRELGAVAGGRVALVGVACTVFVLASIVAGQVAVLRARAARIVVRVAGSWVAATGLLMLGWTLR